MTEQAFSWSIAAVAATAGCVLGWWATWFTLGLLAIIVCCLMSLWAFTVDETKLSPSDGYQAVSIIGLIVTFFGWCSALVLHGIVEPVRAHRFGLGLHTFLR